MVFYLQLVSFILSVVMMTNMVKKGKSGFKRLNRKSAQSGSALVIAKAVHITCQTVSQLSEQHTLGLSVSLSLRLKLHSLSNWLLPGTWILAAAASATSFPVCRRGLAGSSVALCVKVSQTMPSRCTITMYNSQLSV